MSDPSGETSRDRPDGPATDKADPRPTRRTRDWPAEAGTDGMSDASGETNPGTAT
jgi:hypothetical protein